LCREFEEVEIKEEVSQRDGTKILGPDGYNFQFVKSNWETIKGDVISVVKSFLQPIYILKDCNASFIKLVPKKENPLKLIEFKHISLVGCMYKIITNVLANRLNLILLKVIDSSQFAFLSGLGLLDRIFIANKVVDEMKRRKKSGVIVDYDG